MVIYIHFRKSATTGLLNELILITSHQYHTRTGEDTPTYQYRIEAFKTSFLPWTINEWNKLDLVTKTRLTQFSENVYGMKLGPKQIQHIICIILRMLLSWLRLGLSHQTSIHIQHLSWINISFLFALSSFLFCKANTFWS